MSVAMKSNVLANVFQVYNDNLRMDDEFMYGWRQWSFEMTKSGQSRACLLRSDSALYANLKKIGSEEIAKSKVNWNMFRSSIMKLYPSLDMKLSYHDRYRIVFRGIAFVVIDTCFAIKFKMDNDQLRFLLMRMFQESNTKDVPSYFIIIDNSITDSEMEHKLQHLDRQKYANTEFGILEYKKFNPSLIKNRMIRMSAPFSTTHRSLSQAEEMARGGKLPNIENCKYSRAQINDYALIYLMNNLRSSFARCARVALLSDDSLLIKTAARFIAPLKMNVLFIGLPDDYINPFFITPDILSRREWSDWKQKNMYRPFN